MTLEKELKIQSIVILAQSFNPSIFNRHWLVKNNFVDEEAILQNSIFAPGVTQLATKHFSMLVVPEQLQFNTSHIQVDFESEIKDTLLPILDKLKEIPYKAVGLNFNWFLRNSERDIKEITKSLFFIPSSRFFQNFDTDNSKFGTYMSMDFRNTRLRLDIKPVNAVNNETKETSELIQGKFNFHLDLKPETCNEELSETINKWQEFKEESKRLIDLL